MATVKFYTLLYIDTENQSLSKNGVTGPFDKQMRTFIKCCENLNKSLYYYTDYELNVLTNNVSYIRNISDKLNCIEIPFDFKVPKDIKFFAAHYKIDVFRYFAQLGDSDYSFLLDSDVICINKMPLNLANCINNNTPVYYDITSQVYPAYGRETIIKDKDTLMEINSSTGIWAGGEFIGGDNKFFELLYHEIEGIRENYIKNYKILHHQGDEALVSSAIEKLLKKKYLCDVGLFGGIGRYWSGQTLHVQNNWESYLNNFLLHLPSDKEFIANLNSIDDTFLTQYENYVYLKNNVTYYMKLKALVKKYYNNLFQSLKSFLR